MDLTRHAGNAFSQCGDDGVMAKIVSMLPDRDEWCVEFGAWDGIHLSNTRNFILQGYSAVLIEQDRDKFESLHRTYFDNPKVIPLNESVHLDNLDSLLATTAVPTNFDFVSIDIDGYDYHVWDSMKVYRPKVVCIEFNPTIATEVDYAQARDESIAVGSSLAALTRLAKSKGYELVCVLAFNAFYVDRPYFPLFDIADNSIQALRWDNNAVTHIFCGYDGSIHLAGHRIELWHRVVLDERKMQIMPHFLRSYRHSRLQIWLHRLWAKLGWIEVRELAAARPMDNQPSRVEESHVRR